jgi:hypothetical protein
MFLQSIIGVGLETIKDFCIGSFDLSIALWVSNRCIANLDVQIFVVFLEGAAGKLGPVVDYDFVQDPKPADDTFDELDC